MLSALSLLLLNMILISSLWNAQSYTSIRLNDISAFLKSHNGNMRSAHDTHVTLDGSSNRSRGVVFMSSSKSKGFGSKVDFGAPEPRPDLAVWEREYKAFIKRCGAYICSLSWQAYEKMGRGAVYANYDGGKAAGTLSEADEKLGGIPSIFCPLREFEEMKPNTESNNEHADLSQIIKRIKDYDPLREFVVVFQAGGVCGADICRPNIAPPSMAKQIFVEADFDSASEKKRVVVGSDGRIGITYGVSKLSSENDVADAEWTAD